MTSKDQRYRFLNKPCQNIAECVTKGDGTVTKADLGRVMCEIFADEIRPRAEIAFLRKGDVARQAWSAFLGLSWESVRLGRCSC